MKKLFSLFLCLCTLLSGLSLWAPVVSAENMVQEIPNAADVPTTLAKDQLIYSEDFEGSDLDTSATGSTLISELGWFGTLKSNDALSIVSSGDNHAVSVTAKSSARLDTVGILRDDRLRGGDYILEYTVCLTNNTGADERTYGFCSESATTFSSNKNTAWRYVMKENGMSDHHLKINANSVSESGSSLLIQGNTTATGTNSLRGISHRVRVVVDAEFGVSAYLIDGENAKLISATTAASSAQWKKYSSTIGNELRFHILTGATVTFDDIQVWKGKRPVFPLQLMGFQTTSLKNDTHDIRFVAGVTDTDAVSMGFDVTYSFLREGQTVSGTKRIYCEYFYESLSTDFGEDSISAAEEGYVFLIALSVKNIRSDLTINYSVTPFAVYSDGSVPEAEPETKDYQVGQDNLKSAPELSAGFPESTKEFTTDYQRQLYSSVTLADYEAYTDELTSMGYRLYSQNTINGNVYKTFVSDYIVLHVYYLAYNSTVTVLTSDIENWTPYDTSPVSDSPVTTPTFAMASLDYDADRDGTYNHNNGMGFVFTMEDGSYVIIDGGYAADSEVLYQYLYANNKRTDGEILIRAWIITHPDGDHYGCFNQFTADHAKDVTLERFVAQFDQYHITSSHTNVIRTIYSNAAKYEGCKNMIPMAGQVMYFGTLKVEFYFTAEMYQGYVGSDLTGTNESSLAFMAYFGGYEIFFGGDIVSQSILAVTNYCGSALKCDFFQAPHHALNGTNAFYKNVSPTYLIMCTHKEAANERWNEGLYNSQSKLSYLKGMGVVQQIYVADTGKAEIVPLIIGTTVIPQANPFT